MRSDANLGPQAQADSGEQKVAYDPPDLVVLGTLTELTQLGNAPPDELLNDGSQA